MARILVTGGAGYIGSHTCVELLNAGYDVTIVDNLCNSKRTVVDRIQRITGRQITFVEADVRDRSALLSALAGVDGVIHFAGLKAVGESVAKPLAYYDNNLGSTIALCESMAKRGIRALVFSSSATVYGDPAAVPIKEDFPLSCTNPYGWTKLMGEQILRDTAAIHGDWGVLLLRYFNPIGAHESGEIGEDPNGIPNNLLPYIAKVAVGQLPALTIYGNDYPTRDGTGIRDYIHVVDLALSLIHISRRNIPSILWYAPKDKQSYLTRRRNQMQAKRKLAALLLSLCMVLGMLPMTVFAAGGTTADDLTYGDFTYEIGRAHV